MTNAEELDIINEMIESGRHEEKTQIALIMAMSAIRNEEENK